MPLVFNLHHVEPSERVKETTADSLTITPEGLQSLIRSLRNLGWELVSLESCLQETHEDSGGRTHFASSKRAILTFDDGFEDFYHYAWPVLQEEACPATVFVLAGMLAGSNDWDQGHWPEPERDRLLSLPQIQEMGRSSWVRFGSHGFTHQDMRTLDLSGLNTMIHGSYETLSNLLEGCFLPVFAYPYGRFSTTAVDRLVTSPYRYAFTTRNGLWHENTPPYTVPRLGVNRRDANPLFMFLKLLRHGMLL